MFTPNYQHIVDAACNRQPQRIPLYEHNVSASVIEKLTGKSFAHLLEGSEAEQEEFFRHYCGFFRDYGYDVVTFECCIGHIMPGAGCLADSTHPAPITDWASFEAYPWEQIPDIYFKKYAGRFRALRSQMPSGMRAIGGPGNGIFECVQDVTGYENLCYLSMDEPELYAKLFQKVGETNLAIWKRFLAEFGDIYCVCRFGDDLGFKSMTLLSTNDIRTHVLPQYKQIIDAVHQADKPFLLHSCGCIFEVMEDILAVGIDAKHSNEDQIAPFSRWVDDYGSRIGNFGGIDTDAVCRLNPEQMKDYITKVLDASIGHGGFAFGSGNSIPDYVPAENYAEMIRIVRQYRGDFLEE